MMEVAETLNIDFSDFNQLENLMSRHEEFQEMLFGKNEEGEDTITHINEDHIILETHQSNHWVRRNVYWKDGTVEELFDGKW